ncbi:MAG: hypothetical protein LPK18_00705 [Pseudomonadaceae bacterium]|nr:hypothetical protein [Pseudomonadaceae bacterium]
MLRKISLISLFLIFTLGLLFQYSYIKYQQKQYRRLQIEFGHARAIDAYQRALEQVDKNGSDYARRALIIGRSYEIVKLEQWQRNNELKLSEHTEKLLDKIQKYTESEVKN